MADENKDAPSGPEQMRLLVEGIHAQNLDHKALLRVIVKLSQSLDKGVILEAFETGLRITPSPKDDCVLFGDLALRFAVGGKISDIFRVIEGTTTPAKVEIRSELEMRNDT